MKKLTEKYPWWDYIHFLDMVADWMEQSAEHYDSDDAHLISARDTAQKMRFVAQLIRRLRNHDYLAENKVFRNRNDYCDFQDFDAFYFDPKSDKRHAADMKYLFEYLNKHIYNMWD